MATTAPEAGRPRDPALDARAITATLELMDSHGYEGLRVRDVAAAAGVGLGALYRRWPSKQDLVIAALQERSDQLGLVAGPDPRADVLRVLVAVADQLARGGRRLLPVLLAEPDSKLAAAVVATKVEPLQAFLSERIGAVLGDVSDLELRARVGPALLIYALLVTGRVPSPVEIETTVLSAVLGGVSPP